MVGLGNGFKLLKKPVPVDQYLSRYDSGCSDKQDVNGRRKAGTGEATAYVVLTPVGPRVIEFTDFVWETDIYSKTGETKRWPYNAQDDQKKARKAFESLVSATPPEISLSMTRMRTEEHGGTTVEYLTVGMFPDGRNYGRQDYEYYLNPMLESNVGAVIDANM